ncbi:MAG: AAA family ATPase [Muribaculaceae bacterium]|nr:AAA family ATPase [Muribaculaceae bacterium]
MIKVITGIRRSGKSYLLFTIFQNYLKSEGIAEDHMIAIGLDMLENKKYRDPYVILDYITEFRGRGDEIHVYPVSFLYS